MWTQPNYEAKSRTGSSRLSENGIQPKLKIGSPGDKFEQEADRVADAVMRMPEQPVQRKPVEEEEEMMQMQPMDEEEELQMKCRECEKEELQMKPAVQQMHGDGSIYATTDFARQLNATRGQGSPLPGGVQREMLQKMGVDFSNVNVHTGPEATEMNQALGAKAFTRGSDIYFNQHNYDAGISSEGNRLLAHELVHVVQQGEAQVPDDIQCDFAVEPVNEEPTEVLIDEEEIQSAIRYNSFRFFDEDEIRLLRDVLGLSEEPAVIDEDFVIEVANYQHLFGESVDGKIGPDSALLVARELTAEGLNRAGREMDIRTDRTETADNVDSGGRNDIFDAELDHGNARLTLTVRINFNFVPGGAGNWPDAATREDWVEDYIRIVQSRWSYKLLMKRRGRSNDYLKYYATRVLVRESNSSPHYTATVSYETSHAGSSVSGGNTATLDAYDTEFRHRVRHGHDYHQFGATHEFGHMLGLDHIACDNNTDACYGGADQSVRRNIMGSGHSVTTDNADPFLTAMNVITGQDWDAVPFRRHTA